jgi:hypothetical protein
MALDLPKDHPSRHFAAAHSHCKLHIASCAIRFDSRNVVLPKRLKKQCLLSQVTLPAWYSFLWLANHKLCDTVRGLRVPMLLCSPRIWKQCRVVRDLLNITPSFTYTLHLHSQSPNASFYVTPRSPYTRLACALTILCRSTLDRLEGIYYYSIKGRSTISQP